MYLYVKMHFEMKTLNLFIKFKKLKVNSTLRNFV